VWRLELSVRAANCLQNGNVVLLGELVQLEEADLLRLKNLGCKSVKDIKAALERVDLSLGMDVEWPKGSWSKTVYTQWQGVVSQRGSSKYIHAEGSRDREGLEVWV
jgi:hypothetical protein